MPKGALRVAGNRVARGTCHRRDRNVIREGDDELLMIRTENPQPQYTEAFVIYAQTKPARWETCHVLAPAGPNAPSRQQSPAVPGWLRFLTSPQR